MKKNVLSLVLALVMLVSLMTGCGASDNKPVAGAQEKTVAGTQEKTVAGATDTKDTSNKKSSKDIVIGLTLMDYNFTFFQDMLAMAKKTAEKEGVKLITFDGRGDPTKQMKDVEDMLSQKIDALFLNPVDTEAIGPAVLEANQANVPVVTVDVRSTKGKIEAHISSDNVEIGRTAAKYAIEQLTKKNGSAKGTVVMVGYPQISSIRDRMKGFEEVISQNKGVTLVKRDPTSLNVEAALALTDDILQSNPKGKIDIIFGANSTNALGVLSAAESAKRDELQIIGVDEDKDLMAALQRKSPFVAAVVQYPTEMGRIGVEYAVKLAKGEKVDPNEVRTKIELVTRDTINDYMNTKKKIEEEIKDYRK